MTPDADFDVVQSAIDRAAWSSSSYPNSPVCMVDTAGTAYLRTGLCTCRPNTVFQWAAPDIG